MADDFVPTTDGELVLWCQNNIVKIDTYGPNTPGNIDAAVVTAIKDESQAKIDSINAKIQAEEAYGSAVATDRDTTLTELRTQIGDIKRLSTVDDTALEDLGWVRHPKEIDPDTAKPIMKVDGINVSDWFIGGGLALAVSKFVRVRVGLASELLHRSPLLGATVFEGQFIWQPFRR